jgi:hypothetical protein
MTAEAVSSMVAGGTEPLSDPARAVLCGGLCIASAQLDLRSIVSGEECKGPDGLVSTESCGAVRVQPLAEAASRGCGVRVASRDADRRTVPDSLSPLSGALSIVNETIYYQWGPNRCFSIRNTSAELRLYNSAV